MKPTKKHEVKDLLFIPALHEQNYALFKADSLQFVHKTMEASQKYFEVSIDTAAQKSIRQYALWKYYCIQNDRISLGKLYEEINVLANPISVWLGVLLFDYELKNHLTTKHKVQANYLLNSHCTNYYKGETAHLLARDCERNPEKFDSAWFYLLLANDHFNATGHITKSQVNNTELLVSFCTYRRKNLLAIRHANALFDFEKYYPYATKEDSARAYSIRAFMMFREDDFEGTIQDVDIGLHLIDSVQQPKLFQELLKSLLAIHMIRLNQPEWMAALKRVESSVVRCGYDYIEVDRWKGQFLHANAQYKEAILPLERVWKKAILKKEVYTARYSTLCYLLSDVHSKLGDYSKALQFIYANQRKFENYQIDSMLASLKKEKAYPFSPATECANIYYTAYENTGESAYLYSAENFLKFIDSTLYRFMKVGEENALLQFYYESGQYYFDLGLHVYYQLYRQTGKIFYLNRFLEYSEKRKNSLLHRDILLAKNASKSTSSVARRELELRSLIMGEKKKGLRGNIAFNHLVDEYELLENHRQKQDENPTNHPLLIGLNDIEKSYREMTKKGEGLIIVDETDDTWYYTMITDTTIKVMARPFEKPMADSMIAFTTYLSLHQKLPIHPEAKRQIDLFFPLDLTSLSLKKWCIIPDGVYHRLPLVEMFDPQKYQVTTIPSIRVWKVLQDQLQETKKSKVAVFAFSDKTTILDKKRNYLVELPGTYKEAIRLKKEHPNAMLFTGRDATIDNFLKVYQDPEIGFIHLALHGKANSVEKDDVKLYFRTKNGGLDSLYGYDLLRYRSSCKKVVLSACQSGLGKYIKGEGNYSLPRYFMLNGAREVMSSLWDVED
ncbi:MAG: CHAT domain-containing protein [Saprospiraceae bacterium]